MHGRIPIWGLFESGTKGEQPIVRNRSETSPYCVKYGFRRRDVGNMPIKFAGDFETKLSHACKTSMRATSCPLYHPPQVAMEPPECPRRMCKGARASEFHDTWASKKGLPVAISEIALEPASCVCLGYLGILLTPPPPPTSTEFLKEGSFPFAKRKSFTQRQAFSEPSGCCAFSPLANGP